MSEKIKLQANQLFDVKKPMRAGFVGFLPEDSVIQISEVQRIIGIKARKKISSIYVKAVSVADWKGNSEARIKVVEGFVWTIPKEIMKAYLKAGYLQLRDKH